MKKALTIAGAAILSLTFICHADAQVRRGNADGTITRFHKDGHAVTLKLPANRAECLANRKKLGRKGPGRICDTWFPH